MSLDGANGNPKILVETLRAHRDKFRRVAHGEDS